jgi:cell division protein FtsI/penicillin-binding protein 2
MVDIKIVKRRGKLLRAVFVVIGIVFLARIVEVQILRHGTFKDYADSQQKSSMALKSKRGSIYDSRGRLLAYDMEVKSYSVNPRKQRRGGRQTGQNNGQIEILLEKGI